jgi:predicted aspartyl protease
MLATDVVNDHGPETGAGLEGSAVSYLRAPLSAGGHPLVPVIIRPHPQAPAGAAIPAAAEVEIAALIDTGANRSVVSPDVAALLGIAPVAVADLTLADIAVADVPVYAVRILIPATEGAFTPLDVLVGGVRPNTPGAEALIGTDLLAHYTFAYLGPPGHFVLSAEDGRGLPGSS